MLPIKNLDSLRIIRNDAKKKQDINKALGQIQVIVSMGTSAIAAGGRQTMKAIISGINSNKISDIIVKQTGGFGLDAREPIVQVIIGEQPMVTYGNVTPEIVNRILKEHVMGGKPVTAYIIP